jgi:glycosyltransferase involved in cell wall biosynthesis
MSGARRYHIFREHDRSGIANYAKAFQELVLGPCGYEVLDPAAILGCELAQQDGDEFHIQLGIFQNAERQALSALQRSGSRSIDATLHDPPFTSFPYFNFGNTHLDRLSRGFDWYAGSFGLQRRAIEHLRCAFVLSRNGAAAVQRLAPAAMIKVIPHIVEETTVWPATDTPPTTEMLYFGFIGPNKGLERALDLHRKVNSLRPGTQCHVVGGAQGRANEEYLARLKARYASGVSYHGFIPGSDLDAIFRRAGHAILPYQSSRYVVPASGSVLHALRRGLVCWVTPVNAIPELIDDGINGFLLSGDAPLDARRIAKVMADGERSMAVSRQARKTALRLAHYPYQQHFR